MAPGVGMVFLGDYIDRGTQSRPVLEKVAELKLVNPSSVHCLLGNHELLALASLGDARRLLLGGDTTGDNYEWTLHGRQGGQDMLREFGGISQYVAAMQPTAPVGSFLRSLDPALELVVGQRVLFVHAGIPRRVRSREAFDAEVVGLRGLLADEERLTSADFDIISNPFTGLDGMLWDRSIPRQQRIGVSHLASALGVDMIVIGHTRQESITCYGGNIYAVDLSRHEELSALLLRAGHAPAIFGTGKIRMAGQ